MADVTATFANLNSTESGNAPSGATAVGTGLDDNLRMIEAHQAAARDASGWFGLKLTSVSGTNTVVGSVAAQGSITMAPTAYANGMRFHFIPAATNTGASTLNVSSLGAKNIFSNGAACLGGELVINVPVQVEYDGTQFHILGSRKATATTCRVFTAGGTYTPPADVRAVLVMVQAPGGGGGGADSDTVGSGAGGGGGAGGYAEKLIAMASLGATETVTIGAVGTAGSATNGTSGGTGGTTSFGSHCSATGGVGGSGCGVSVTNGVLTTGGGAGGTGSNGTINTQGSDGGVGLSSGGLIVSGYGGSSVFGAGAGGKHITGGTLQAGGAGHSYGGGGSGALTQSDATGAAGGAGGPGIVIVYEYY